MNIWHNSKFFGFFLSFTIGNLGDWFDVFALQIIFLHEYHASPILMGILILFYFLPSIVLSPIAGVVTDTFSKRQLMLFTDIISTFLTIGLFFSHHAYETLLILFIRSAIVCFNSNAQQAYIKNIVIEDHLLKATSYTTMALQGCKIVGPILGASILVYSSARTCIAINAFSFILSAFILAFLPKDNEKPQQNFTLKSHLLKNIFSGIRYIKNKNILYASISIVIIWFFCSMLRQAQLGTFLQHIFPFNKNALGFFMGFEGLGAVISSAILSNRSSFKSYFLYFSLGFILLAIGIFICSIYQSLWSIQILYISAFIIGLGTGIQLVTYSYLIKKETPAEQIGSIIGTTSALQNIALATGTLSSGFFVLHFGIKEVYCALSFVMISLALFALFFFANYEVKASNTC